MNFKPFFCLLIYCLSFQISRLACNEHITIISYNILNPEFVPFCNSFHIPSESLSWDVRKNHIIKRIMSFNPDIICLQELNPHTFEDLKVFFQGVGFQGVFQPNDDSYQSGIATFYRSLLFSSVEMQPVICPNTSRCGLKPVRSAIITTFKTHLGSLFKLINTKFKWFPKETPREKNTNFKQFHYLRNEFIVKDLSAPWIIAGDFNATPEDLIIKFFTEDGFVNLTSQTTPWTCYANGKRTQIDHILTQKSIKAEPLKTFSPFLEGPIPNYDEPSDHLPVVIRILLDQENHGK